MALPAVCGTGIRDQGHQVTQVTGIAHRRADALVGQKSAYNQKVDSQIAENVVDVSGNKHARRGFGKLHFIIERFDLIEHLSIPAAFGYIKAGDFVIEAAVPAIPGHAFDGGIEHLDFPLTAAHLQAPHIGNDRFFQLFEKIGIFYSGRFRCQALILIFPAIGPGIVILDIDIQQRRSAGYDGNVSAQSVDHCLLPYPDFGFIIVSGSHRQSKGFRCQEI